MKKNTFDHRIKAIHFNFLLIITLLCALNSNGQVRVNFNPRTPVTSPGTTIHHVKGDFSLIGNTNLTLSSYGNSTNNSNNTMQYVDVDTDNTTFNSSSATLTYSNENGANPNCTNVVFAGLYWTGRSSNGSSSPDIFDVTKNSITKTFNKRKVSLKGPNSSSYTTITAGQNDIYYPTNSDGFMYSAYADITTYVKANGLGEYTVADIALIEGNGGGTGYYGGWGIIVIYENSKMKWRDITVFDGHAYVQGNTTINHQIPISGFNAVQTGQVNVKLGLMAGEGDVGISGDYFNILKSSTNTWEPLTHNGNTTTNFFNSSIQTGGNFRNPNLQNNTGLDISMFDIPNTGNTIIANNQTSTTLRYGSTQDTYVIFLAALAVDAYIPDAEGVMSLITINGQPANGGLTALPGEELEYSIKILNEGTEPVANTKIKIEIPYPTSFVSGSESGTINFIPLPTPNNLIFNPSMGSNGTLVWDIGTLPVPNSPTDILGELKFKIKVTEDCFILSNPNCTPNIPLYGYISGMGAITGIIFNEKPFIQGYQTTGTCLGDPITDPIIVSINSGSYINQNCQNTNTTLAFTFCNTNSPIPVTDISTNYPNGTKFYNEFPITNNSIEYNSSNPFPSTLGTTTYYAVPPNTNNCFHTFTITIIVSPTVSIPSIANINGCNTSAISPLVYSETPVSITLQDFLNAGGTVSNSNLTYTITYQDSQSGSCPITVNRKYNIVTSCSDVELIQTFTIQDTTDPIISVQAQDLTVQCDGNGNISDLNNWLAANGGASASDVCSSVTWSNDFSAVSDGCGASGSVTVTFTATDDCGNDTTTSATFTIQDTTDPIISVQAQDLTVQCDGNGNISVLNNWLAANGGASASDVCSSVTWSNDFSAVSDGCGASGSVTVTFTATDDCGNDTTTSATFTIQDTTDPIISVQAQDLTVQCDGNGNISDLNNWLAANGGASASDVCSSVTWSNDFSAVSDGCGASGSVTVTFTATDDCGNDTTTSATFTIQDTTDPIISVQAQDLTVQCDGNGNISDLNNWLAANGGASASDVCSSVTWSNDFSAVSDGCGASGSVTVTFTATDDCGNDTTTSATFTIQDTTDPIISVQAQDLTVQCDGNGNISDLNNWLAANGGASASDVCSSVTWSNDFSSVSDGCGASGSVTVTFTATDDCGNDTTTSATFTIQDTTDPIISVQAQDLTVQCDGNGNISDLNNWLAANGGASASDVCSSVTWSNDFSAVSDGCGASGSVTVTFTATDDCGNDTTTSATFTIQDTTDPIISVQAADLTVQCDGNGNISDLNNWLAANGGASASDVCSSVTWSNDFSAVSDGCGASGSVTVTFTATDDCGNDTTTSATFTIQDTTDPIISVQAQDLTVQCDGNGNISDLNNWLAANGGASASDVCSSVTWSNDFSAVSDGCGATGTVTVTFTATDDCGNDTTTSATFTIQDTTDPIISVQAQDLTVQCDGNGNISDLNNWLAANGGASASDVCSSVTWSNDFSAVSDGCGASGSVTVTFTATDDCGNDITTSATFTIQDTTDPIISVQAQDLTVQCDGNGNISVLNNWLAANGGASASDVCSSVTWSNDFSAVSDGCGASGSVTVTFTATDDCGNDTTTSATFTIQDTTDPIISVQAQDLTVQCDGNGNISDLNNWLAANGGASASDVCSSVTWSNDFSAVSDGCGATGTVTVTFTATDDCGNDITTSATFTIQDTTDPIISVQAQDLTVQCDGNGNISDLNNWLAANGGASASDVCSSVTWSNDFSAVSDGCGASGSVTVTFTATDDCGNDITTSATFTIQDTTDPIISVQAQDLTVQCDGNGNISDLNNWLNSNGGASASDVCSSVTWSNDFSAVSDGCGASGSVTVTFTATDDCGNDTTTSATFTIQDTTDPIISVQAQDLTVQCDGNGNISDLNNWLAANGGASASDVCSSVTWSNDFSAVSDGCGASGSVTITFTATDDCGNDTTTSATFTIQDTTDPIISVQAQDLTVQCDGNGNISDLNNWLAANGGASASDVCSSVTWSNDFSAVSDGCGATGTVTVTFTATDDCGNDTTTSATFTIQDTTDPIISVQAQDLTVQCDGNGNISDLNNWLAANGGASASDVCSSVTWSNDFSAVSDGCGASGSVTVTFTATDDCGNDITTSATFTIQDTTDPIISVQAQDLTVQCDGNGNISDLNNWLAANGGASASDVCSSVTWSNDFSAVSDGCGASGSVTVTFTATDDCGNDTTTSATFTIQDTTDPIFTSELPNDISVSCDDIPSPAEIEASDNCDSDVDIAVNDLITFSEGNCTGNYSISRTWIITDDCGNSNSYTQTITVYDSTPPTLLTPIDEELNVNCSNLPDIPNLEFTDNCSGVSDVVYSEVTTTISIYEYIIVREWYVSDNCGNFDTFTQTINVTVDDPFDAIPFGICTKEEPINLFTILGSSIPTNGEWIDLSETGGLNENIFNPLNIPVGYYTLQYIVSTENNDCPMIFEVYLNINEDCIVLPACDITIYNAVSPNNDGLNDFFFIDGIDCYPNNTVEIYNKWGILIYETKGYDNNINAFRGQSEGRSTLNKNEGVPDGTYYYILKYVDEENKTHDKAGYLYVSK
ncbi:gliding motility-associated C-terminal domain-containing protein [Flavobacterium sp.]|uniref:T9SS type B sorting domain-containing protein n=1 Tax=Flavobacterium sp. TaxID=239 RepID=UPI003D2BB452